MLKLPILVTVPLMDKYTVRSIMENNNLMLYIMLLTGVTWQAPHKLYALIIQGLPIPDVQIDF